MKNYNELFTATRAKANALAEQLDELSDKLNSMTGNEPEYTGLIEMEQEMNDNWEKLDELADAYYNAMCAIEKAEEIEKRHNSMYQAIYFANNGETIFGTIYAELDTAESITKITTSIYRIKGCIVKVATGEVLIEYDGGLEIARYV